MTQLNLFDKLEDIIQVQQNGTPGLQKDLQKPKSPASSEKKVKPLKVGENVNYHSIIGKSITSSNHRIYHIDEHKGWVWITNHSGCVSMEALSRRKLI